MLSSNDNDFSRRILPSYIMYKEAEAEIKPALFPKGTWTVDKVLMTSYQATLSHSEWDKESSGIRMILQRKQDRWLSLSKMMYIHNWSHRTFMLEILCTQNLLISLNSPTSGEINTSSSSSSMGSMVCWVCESTTCLPLMSFFQSSGKTIYTKKILIFKKIKRVFRSK